MKKAVVLFLTVLLVFIFCCELKASSLQKSIVPAEALWVVHVDLIKFKASRLGDIVLNKINALGLKDEVGHFQKQYKMDLLNDIEGVTAIGLGKDENDIVVCLKGNFNQDFLLGLLGMEDSHQEIPYGKYTLHNWNKDEFGAFVDDLALITQNKNALMRVLDVISGKKADISSSSLMAYLKKVPPNAFVSAMAKDISAIAKGETEVFVFKKMKSALLTLAEVKENLDLRLDFMVDTIEDANNIENAIKGLIALANMHLSEEDSALRIPKDIVISTKKNKVQIELVYPTEDLVNILLGKVKGNSFF